MARVAGNNRAIDRGWLGMMGWSRLVRGARVAGDGS